ncbi:hypothetical protein [Synechocystis sp. PCC 7509]|uniref:hypothetical protein n=1 Tax=Synechocystis sp. PCC 7509 TaxID=927677 RepID=UPI0002ABCD31|nr:hypothetical protein [Synechocystis sp. PCC 7509]
MTNYKNGSEQNALLPPKSDRETYLALNMAAMAYEEDYDGLAQLVRQVYDPNFDMAVYADEFRIISTYKTGEIIEGIIKVSVLYAGGFSDYFFVVEPWCESEIYEVIETNGIDYTEAAEDLINFIAEKKRCEKV